MPTVFDDIFSLLPGQHFVCDSFEGDGKRSFFALCHVHDRSQLPYVEIDDRMVSVGSIFNDSHLRAEYCKVLVNLEAGDLFFKIPPAKHSHIKVYYALDFLHGPSHGTDFVRRMKRAPSESSLHQIAAHPQQFATLQHLVSQASIPYNLTLPPYQPCRDVLVCNGTSDRFPLAYVPIVNNPSYSYSARRTSDGMSLAIGIAGLHSMIYAHGLLELRPTSASIVFDRVYPQGESIILDYYYDAAQSAQQAANSQFSSYGNSKISLNANAPSAVMPAPTSVPQRQDRSGQMPEVPGWQPYDYEDYYDLESAVGMGNELEYAQCVWLMNQRDNAVVFTEEKWEAWYQYAVEHCDRFAKTQPRG